MCDALIEAVGGINDDQLRASLRHLCATRLQAIRNADQRATSVRQCFCFLPSRTTSARWYHSAYLDLLAAWSPSGQAVMSTAGSWSRQPRYGTRSPHRMLSTGRSAYWRRWLIRLAPTRRRERLTRSARLIGFGRSTDERVCVHALRSNRWLRIWRCRVKRLRSRKVSGSLVSLDGKLLGLVLTAATCNGPLR